MTTHVLSDDSHHHDDSSSKATFGFWIYVMTDFVLFAVLFATYAVLRDNTYGGPGIMQITHLQDVLIQTLILLTSVFTYGLGLAAFHRERKNQVLFWLAITFLLGLAFLGLEVCDLIPLIQQGYTWQTSGFLSAFFSVIGIHGTHVLFGLIWILILMIQLSLQNLTPVMKTRLICLSLFWNFLNIVWVFIFTIVYLMGAI